MDVIFKEGTMYLQGVKFGKRTWRKMWMVLFKPSSTGVGRLELCTVQDNQATSDRKPVRLETPEKKVVRLSDCLSVTPAPEESSPPGCTAFYLSTTQSTYILASSASQDWLRALCHLAFQKDPGESDKGVFERGNGLIMEDNDLYSSWTTDRTCPPNHYRVIVQSTQASRRCNLTGEYLIYPDTEAVSLLDIQTAHVIYHWPYKLLRKFGQVERGFSIEAGRRCETGEGVFIFLSESGPQIFQTISRQCSVNSKRLLGPYRRSFSEQLPVNLSCITSHGPPVYKPAENAADAEDDSASHYSTINDTFALNVRRPTLVSPQLANHKQAMEDDGEDERCHSLETLSLDHVIDDSIYYNVRRAKPPVIRPRQAMPEKNKSETIYSDVKKVEPPPDPELEIYSSPVLAPLHHAGTLPSVSYALPKSPDQHQNPANDCNQPGYNAQAPPVGDMKDAVSSSTSVTPSEAPGSFKQRLAEIISKDLAKLHSTLPFGPGSPSFPQ